MDITYQSHMNKERVEQLRQDLGSVFRRISQEHLKTEGVVNAAFSELGRKYPELVGIYPQPKTKDHLKDVREKLFESKDPSPLTSYDGIENNLKSGSPDECLESILGKD